MNSPTFDPSQKFIRIVEQRADGMVEFEFAVGEPELFVEMLLPQAAFDDFCRSQGVHPANPLLPAGSAPHGPATAATPASDDSTEPADEAAQAEQMRQDLAWTLHDAMAWSSRHRL